MKLLTDKIAIVGMSGIFPGALDLAQFGRNIMHKVEAIDDIPEDRWIVRPEEVLSPHYQPDRASSRRAGLVSGFRFDPDGFLVDRDLLLELDPLHHMVLHAGREALLQCHCNQKIRERTGVVLAAIALPTARSSEVAWQIVMEQRRSETLKSLLSGHDSTTSRNLNSHNSLNALTSADSLAAGMVSLPAALLATSMGLMGGSFTLDAACASSLYAIKIACQELRCGKRDMMVAGGVSRPDSLYTQIGFTQLKALSPSGRCSPFDKNADGLVVGEGAGIVVLKRVEDALKSGDRILGLIAGAGWSNDIEGNLVAPSSEGQIRAMRAAYRAAGWSPADVQYIECHGSATPVGDNIELNSMSRLWQDAGLGDQGCAIGSVKSMTGHLLTAAGAAGFIKTVLALNEKLLPPSLNFSEPALNSPLLTTGFHVQTEPEEWRPAQLKGIGSGRESSGITNRERGGSSSSFARRAGISAFGFGGINGHILVEEFRKDNLSLYFSGHEPSSEAAYSTEEEPGSAERALQKEISAASPIAVVGMEVITAAAMNLEEFRKKIFRGSRSFRGSAQPEDGSLEPEDQSDETQDGLWMREITTHAGEFHIPPNQIEDLLPQHLLMLKAAMGAMKDGGISPRPAKGELPREKFGAAIGIEFDYGATDFHLRWRSREQNISPPLTAERTLGALGGIVASRVAREFKLGGPCFTVSGQASSGIKALEIAIESLRRKETTAFLCGAVDMAGDMRQNNLNRTLRSHASDYDSSIPFDRESKGLFPSEGACAVLLKTLEQAQLDGDRIYAVIRGAGTASGADITKKTVTAETSQPAGISMLHGSQQHKPVAMRQIYAASLSEALNGAGISLSDVGLYQAHGSGEPLQDALELEVINSSMLSYGERNGGGNSCAIGSTSATMGDTGALSGLLSTIQAALALYHQIVPPLAKFSSPAVDMAAPSVHFPKFPAFWIKDSYRYSRGACVTSDIRRACVTSDIRRACVASMTTDGTASHLVVEEFTIPPDYPARAQIDMERSLPLGINHEAILTEAEMPERTELTTSRDNKSIEERGKIAFLYPGSGNHFPGMGRKLGALFPDILRAMDEDGASLNRRMLPDLYYPRRISWEDGWQEEALARINSHPHNMIFGQVSFGTFMTRVAEKFGIKPDACIGHSLGESAGLFALRAWRDPEEMLTRMESSDLFTKKLAGECTAAREVWQLKDGEAPEWRVAAVNRSREFVESLIRSQCLRSDHSSRSGEYESDQAEKSNRYRSDKVSKYDRLHLLIVNTPDECVIGGDQKQVEQFIREAGCGAMYLDGVVTVHCPVAEVCKEEYLALHRFACHPPEGIDFYSCALAGRYIPETEATAQSILDQALYGFDYTKLINNAWSDGIRLFIEMGPGSSCTRAVSKILGDRPHLALSLSSKDEDEEITLVRALATLAANGVALDMATLCPELKETLLVKGVEPLSLPVHRLNSYLPDSRENPDLRADIDIPKHGVEPPLYFYPADNSHSPLYPAGNSPLPPSLNDIASSASAKIASSAKVTSDAHMRFLEFSQENMVALERQFSSLTKIASDFMKMPDLRSSTSMRRVYMDALQGGATSSQKNSNIKSAACMKAPPPLFDRDMCMEFAVGSAANVLGESFDVIDTYPVRVRLPGEPLMLVDRIIDIEGEMLSLKSGKIITQHDVKHGAWYLDGGKAPVSISIEAGQADLFLCSWLGIDHAVMGKRRYRLLDAKVTFHRTLPEPGETIEYHIEIDRFLKQGEIYLFFFHYRGFINSELLISMRDGCAGFFTPEEVKNSGGIILKREDSALTANRAETGERESSSNLLLQQIITGEYEQFVPVVPLYQEQYSDTQVDNLRVGELGACFGKPFEGVVLGRNLRLPGGRSHLDERMDIYRGDDQSGRRDQQSRRRDPESRMHLIDRVLNFDPAGGRFGRGFISAEADIHPDEWFLTCHFVDDMVMPGTLMYECCAHALRIFTQRVGWISTRDDLFYDVIPALESDLKCRGPVTTQTRKARYEIEIKEMGYGPEPFVIADAHMFSDDHRIVLYKDMGMKIAGLSRSEIELFWSER